MPKKKIRGSAKTDGDTKSTKSDDISEYDDKGSKMKRKLARVQAGTRGLPQDRFITSWATLEAIRFKVEYSFPPSEKPEKQLVLYDPSAGTGALKKAFKPYKWVFSFINTNVANVAYSAPKWVFSLGGY